MSTNTVAIDQEMRRSYLDYSMSVIIGRAIPDVRDGLKPVHRRILFAMQDLGNTHTKAYKKSARIVGDVIGKYHPHGDQAVYDAIVRMAQPFSLRYPLVDGQGNFGSVDGDPAAAMRYTEIRMSRIAEEMLADLEKNTVDFHPNYDESLQEPDVLPTRIPGLLLNGSSGIAVGMATSIPPHNATELMTALIALVDKPDLTLPEIMRIIPGPDFPTGGIIISEGEIEKAYRTGRGIIIVRGKVEREEEQNREKIIISEIPFTVNKADLVTRIALLAQEKKIDGIANIRDESDKDGMRVVVDLKKGAPAEVIENQLYKLTTLQTSFSMNLLAIHNGRPATMGLLQLLQAFLDFREEVVTRRCLFELAKAKDRIHILDGLLKALEHIDEIVALIKASANPPEAKVNLMERFGFSEIQAQAILDMRLQRLTGLERDKLADEHAALSKEIRRLELILSDRNELLKVIRAELEEVKADYSDARRTLILKGEIGEFNMEDLIPDEKMVVTITRKGYVKRTELDKYRTQKRGGVGVKGALTGEDDFIEHIFVATNHTSILYFTNKGRVYHTKVYEIPERDRAFKGVPIVNIQAHPERGAHLRHPGHHRHQHGSRGRDGNRHGQHQTGRAQKLQQHRAHRHHRLHAGAGRRGHVGPHHHRQHPHHRCIQGRQGHHLPGRPGPSHGPPGARGASHQAQRGRFGYRHGCHHERRRHGHQSDRVRLRQEDLLSANTRSRTGQARV